jgi:hypothetical protein
VHSSDVKRVLRVFSIEVAGGEKDDLKEDPIVVRLRKVRSAPFASLRFYFFPIPPGTSYFHPSSYFPHPISLLRASTPFLSFPSIPIPISYPLLTRR